MGGGRIVMRPYDLEQLRDTEKKDRPRAVFLHIQFSFTKSP
jgi:hypothetical protein